MLNCRAKPGRALAKFDRRGKLTPANEVLERAFGDAE
jgi:hypothetical protein